MATYIWQYRGRVSVVLSLMVAASAAFLQLRLSPPALATSGGSAYALPVVVDTNAAPNIVETTIIADEATVNIGGPGGGVMANTLTFNGTVPGPQFRLNVGDTVIVHYQNNLSHPSGIHWHGIELDNHSDGTPLTQDMVAPNATYLYKFKVTRPGIYWYHPHHHSSTNQVFKGLYGVIIVTDPNEASLISNGIIPSAGQTLTLGLSDITVCKNQGNGAGTNDTATYNPALPWVGGGALPAQAGPTPKTLCETSPIDEDGVAGPAFVAGDVPNIQASGPSGSAPPVNEGQTVLTNGRNVGGRAGSPLAPGALDAWAETYLVTEGQGLRLQIVNMATTRFMRLRLTDHDGSLVPLIKSGGQGGILDKAVRLGNVIGPPAPTDFIYKYEAGEVLVDPGDRIDVAVAIPIVPGAPKNGPRVLTLWTEDFQRTGGGFYRQEVLKCVQW